MLSSSLAPQPDRPHVCVPPPPGGKALAPPATSIHLACSIEHASGPLPGVVSKLDLTLSYLSLGILCDGPDIRLRVPESEAQ